jgi:hypothetical protein
MEELMNELVEGNDATNFQSHSSNKLMRLLEAQTLVSASAAKEI